MSGLAVLADLACGAGPAAAAAASAADDFREILRSAVFWGSTYAIRGFQQLTFAKRGFQQLSVWR